MRFGFLLKDGSRRIAVNALGFTIACLVAVLGATDASASTYSDLAAGNSFTCGITLTRSAECWGGPRYASLGNNSYFYSENPVEVEDFGGDPLTSLDSVAAGSWHACATDDYGDAWCWGENNAGQLGNGATIFSRFAVPVLGPTGTGHLAFVKRIAAGQSTTCALDELGAVFCWGFNLNGEVGGGLAPSAAVPLPVKNSTLPVAAVSVSVGSHHSCALLVDRTAWCWGLGADFGMSGLRTSPVQVLAFGDDVTAVRAQGNSTCAVASGALKCLGRNADGQLGNGSISNSSSATDVIGFTTGTRAFAGGPGYTNHAACAVSAAFQLKCWGRMMHGSLGDGASTQSSTPIPVSGIVGSITKLTVSASHICALASGRPYCWGQNAYGELGAGTKGSSTTGIAVSGLSTGVDKLAASNTHSCALLSGGSVKCWGINTNGELGTGDELARIVPTAASALASVVGITRVVVGKNFTCVLASAGVVYCLGKNDRGQLGAGSTLAESSVPLAVTDSGGAPLTGVTQISAGNGVACAVMADTSAKCWGAIGTDEFGGNSATFAKSAATVKDAGGAPVTNVQATSVGVDHRCIQTIAGTVSCWGLNALGQLGDGSTTASDVPVMVRQGSAAGPALTGVTALSAGYEMTCAVASTNVYCWGNARNGALGNLSGSGVYPFAVQTLRQSDSMPLSGAVDVAAGDSYACAATSVSMYCWGGNTGGNLGTGNQYYYTGAIVPIGVSSAPSALATGWEHTCAVFGSAASCWGDDLNATIGNGEHWKATPQAMAGSTASTDSTAPVVTVTSVTTPDDDPQPVVDITVVDDGPIAETTCAVDAGAPIPCSESFSPTPPLADGAHVITVVAMDIAGNTGSSATDTFVVDTTAPAISFTAPGAGAVVADGGDIDVTFTVEDAHEFSVDCEIDEMPEFECDSPLTVSGEGPHTVEIDAMDIFGNADTSTLEFTIDSQAPQPTITPLTPLPSLSKTPTFGFTDGDPDPSGGISMRRCRIDSGSFVNCVSPFTTPTLTEGLHSLTVAVTDGAGNIGTTTLPFDVQDTSPPTVSIAAPPSPTNDATPTFTIATEAGATLLCRIDDATPTPCSSPYTPPPLADGGHVLHVSATDTAGNVGVADSPNVVVDTIGPTITVGVSEGQIIVGTSALVSVSVTGGPIASSSCSLDGGPSHACGVAVPVNYAGSHTLTVTATDTAGNSTALTRNFQLVPVTPPAVAPTLPALLGLKTTHKPTRPLKFLASCPEGCTVSVTLVLGKKRQRLASLTLTAGTSPRPVQVKFRPKIRKAIHKALAKRKKATLTVQAVNANAGAGQPRVVKLKR